MDEVMNMRKLTGCAVVFLIGGAVYSMLEIAWRGYTHWSMTLCGGLCFLVLYALHVHARALPLLLRCLLGSLSITALEFAAGCIVNLWLGWDVWEYSADMSAVHAFVVRTVRRLRACLLPARKPSEN